MGHRGQRILLQRRRRRRPVGQENPKVHERIAQRAHLPVEHGHQVAEIERVEEHVIKFEITVNDGWPRRIRRDSRRQPGCKALHLRHIVDPRPMPAIGPALDLTGDEACGFAQGGDRRRRNVDRVQIRERVDERFADAPARLRVIGERHRFVVTDHDPSSAFHHIEHRPDHGRIFAEHVGTWRERKDGMRAPQASDIRAPCRALSAAPVRAEDAASRARRRRSE